MKPPDLATHDGYFASIVPIWFADQPPNGCAMQGKGWFVDKIALPTVTLLFQLGAPIFGWDEFPILLNAKPLRDDK